jgi:tetratricopeptide (TPR) repeat protein
MIKKTFYIIIFAALAFTAFLAACTDKKAEAHKLVKSGIIKLYQSNYSEALDDFTKAAEYDPENPEIWYNIGNVHMNLKDYQKAIEYYNKAIGIKEDYADAYYNRGLIKFYMGEPDLACDDWKIAEKYGKKNVDDKTRHCD